MLARIRAICLALPETSERLSHGAPTFFVRGKRAFVMVLTDHHGDGRFALWCAAPEGMQKMLVEAPSRGSMPFVVVVLLVVVSAAVVVPAPGLL